MSIAWPRGKKYRKRRKEYPMIPLALTDSKKCKKPTIKLSKVQSYTQNAATDYSSLPRRPIYYFH